MWELDYKESWVLKSWCFWTVVLKRTVESLLDCNDIQPANPKRYKSWVFIERTDAEAKTPLLWPPDAKNWVIGKDPDAGKDWRQEKKRMTEDEMVGWHHWPDEHEFEQAPGFGDGQGSLSCCSPWSHKESDTTEWLNWQGEKKIKLIADLLLFSKTGDKFFSQKKFVKCFKNERCQTRNVSWKYISKMETKNTFRQTDADSSPTDLQGDEFRRKYFKQKKNKTRKKSK